MNETIKKITERIIKRSEISRAAYVHQMEQAELKGRTRTELSCGNLAHAFAACNDSEKDDLTGEIVPNLAIISAYNDMLSAHKPYETYPNQLRAAARKNGAVAQFAGGVPAMCDGVTQGQDGMDLSLLSRDVIAMSTAIALSHNMFDGTICLGICDKIVPGQLIGALKFGHLPTIFVPGGPMETGISNEEKSQIRQDYAQGLISRADLLNPETPLRYALTDQAVKQLITNIKEESKVPLYKIISEKSIVNGIVGLLATGGSTNHTMHLVAIAKAAGIIIDWEDFSELSGIIPSITRVYPNGKADINHFHAAGGMSYVFRTLLDNGLLNEDVMTVVGKGLRQYINEWYIENDVLLTREGPKESLDKDVISSANNPFDPEGGIKLLKGNMGKAVAKVSAVAKHHMVIEAPAMVFDDQNDLLTAFKEKKLNQDFIAVVRFQGPKAKGMPELHKLTPTLSILQHNGLKVALVTDGRMSGASGKVPSAIHVSPEALDGGLLPLLRDGDLLRLDCEKGELICLNEEEVIKREPVPNPEKEVGSGRELFDNVRALISSSETGATIF